MSKEEAGHTACRLRSKATELNERSQLFYRQIEERKRWIESCDEQAADLWTAIRALEATTPPSTDGGR